MKVSKRFMWLLTAAVFAVIAAGGCGGGSSSGGGGGDDDPVTEEMPLDPSKDLVGNASPLFSIGWYDNSIFIKASDKPELKPGQLPEPLEISVPAQVRSVMRPPYVSEGTDGQSALVLHDKDTFRVHLDRDVRYSVEVSRNLGTPLGAFIPEVSIIDPSGETVPDNILGIAVAAEPKEDPSVIVRSFTPNRSGYWIVTVQDAGQRSEGAKDRSTGYILRLFRENGQGDEIGHPTRFLIDGHPLSLRDVMILRRAAHGVNIYKADSVPPFQPDSGSFRSVLPAVREGSENYKAMMLHINRVKARSSVGDSSRTQLELIVDDVLSDSTMDNGRGFYATTGKAAGTAIDKFDLSGGINEPESEYSSTFITTKEEHEQEIGIKTSASYSSAGNSVSASAEYTSGIKYGLTSTTLVVHYHKWDRTYKTPDKYTISETALAELKDKGYDEWRKTYGDYFVAGRRMGAQIDAYLAITSDSTEEIQNVKDAMAGKTPSLSGSAEFTKALKDAVSHSKIKVTIRKRGDANSENHFSEVSYDLKDDADIDDMMAQVQSFVEATQSDTFKFVTLNVRMASYAEAENAGGLIPKDIPVDPDCFTKIRTFITEMLGLASYYNDISSIPDENVRDSNVTKAGWKSDYDSLINDINGKLDDICSSASSLDDYTGRIKTLSDKYRLLFERWCFYRALMTAQKKQPGSGYNTCGYNGFAVSAAVDGDFRDTVHEHHKQEEEGPGWLDWEPNRVTDPETLVWAYFKISHADWVTTTNDPECKDWPTLGRNRFHWYLESDWWRGVEWDIYMRPVDLSDTSKYPFTGLK